jgi:WD40 repeat protein
MIVTGGHDGRAPLREAGTLEVIGQPLVHDQHVVYWVEFSSDDRLVLTASADVEKSSITRSMVQFWDVATREPVGPALPLSGRINASAFSPDGRWMALGLELPWHGRASQERWEVQVWPVASAKGGHVRQIRTALEARIGATLENDSLKVLDTSSMSKRADTTGEAGLDGG